MIRFENVTKAYGQKDLFKGLSFNISSKDKCSLIGRNATGKTTLFRVLTKKESIDSGVIQVPKDYTFGYLDQHISFKKNTILEEAISDLTCEEWEKEYKAETILFGLGFQKEDMNKDPKELSGGYQLRVKLAKVLLSEPSCLLLDEPTNYLDIVSIHWLKKFLKAWTRAFIIISHDREFLDAVSSHTLGLHRGEIFKIKGETNAYFDLILNKEKNHEATLANLEKKREHLESFIKRFGAKATKASQAKSKQKALEKIPALEQLVQLHSLDFSFNEAPFPGRRILEAKNISFSYDKKENKKLIKNLSFSIDKGEKIAIIGKNGYGKSTILKLLSDELSPDDGVISISENGLIGYFGQTNISRLNPSNSVIEEISEANSLLNIGQVRRICGTMMFAKDDAEKKISVLSGGEKSRVLLGKILASPCNLLLLDEPTNHLDMESIESLLEAIENFSGAIVIVTHSEMILNRLSLDKLIVCNKNSQSFFLGNYKEFLQKDGWEEDEITNDKKNKIKKKNSNVVNLKASSSSKKEIKKEIKKIEDQITTLEKNLKREEMILIEASEKGDKDQIIKSTQQAALIREEIDLLYKKYEKLLDTD